MKQWTTGENNVSSKQTSPPSADGANRIWIFVSDPAFGGSFSFCKRIIRLNFYPTKETFETKKT